MDISIFEVLGPVMVGPSSSHTAGATRLARIGGIIAGQSYNHVSFGLHGSFAKTYKGHGTDKALVAGVLGLKEDDESLVNAFELAMQKNITYDFYDIELDNVHENSVKMTFYLNDGGLCEVIGSSIGGAQILITSINGFETEITAQSSTLVISQHDKKGVVSDISTVLANNDINIGIMKLSRRAKGDIASCIIETDDVIPDEAIECLKRIKHVISVKVINV
jgi:L-serine dehydratase